MFAIQDNLTLNKITELDYNICEALREQTLSFKDSIRPTFVKHFNRNIGATNEQHVPHS